MLVAFLLQIVWGDNQVSTLKQDSDPAQEIQALIDKSTLLEQQGNAEEAVLLLEKAMEDFPQSKRLVDRLVQSHLRHGRLDEATTMLETIRETDPNDPQTGLLLAQLLMRQGRLGEADTLLDKLHTKTPNVFKVDAARVELFIRQAHHAEAIALCNDLVAKNDNRAAYMLRARTMVRLGETDKAEDDFNHLTTIEPNNPGLWAAKSSLSLSVGNVSMAVDAIDRALALDPQNPLIQKQAIRTYILSGDPNRVAVAEQALQRALQRTPLDPELLLNRVAILQRTPGAEAKNQTQAILEQVTDTNPEKHQAWVVWIELLLRRNTPGEAIETVIRALIHHPNDRTLLLLKARAESGLSPGLAVRTYEGLLALDPEDIEVHLLLAYAYTKAEMSHKAVDLLVSHREACPEVNKRDYEFALAAAWFDVGETAQADALLINLSKTDPNDERLIMIKVDSLLKDKRLRDIVSEARQWLEGHPSDDVTINRLAAHIAGGRGKESRATAITILRDALARNPESVRCLLTLAQILHVSGGSDELLGLYEKIVQLDPGNVVAMNNLAWMLSSDKGQHEQALTVAEKGLALAPEYPDLLDTHGVICFHLKKYDAAIDSLTKSVRLFPSDSPAGVGSRYYLAKALEAVGRTDEARRHLDRCLRLHERTRGLTPEQERDARLLQTKLSGGAH